MNHEKRGKTCSEFEAFLEDYISSELSAPSRKAVEAHLQNCPACASAVEEAAMSSRLLRLVHEPVEDPGPFFTRRVIAAVRSEQECPTVEGGIWKPLEILSLRAAWTAAAALALLLTYGAVSGISTGQPVAQVQQRDPAGLFPDPLSPMASQDDVLMPIAEVSHGK
ncbi:MAG: zf-HC2 domain-containing protein [Candidatus Acidiferrales bacterium]